jgi:hypothetical protein
MVTALRTPADRLPLARQWEAIAVSGATNLAVNRNKHERRPFYQRV